MEDFTKPDFLSVIETGLVHSVCGSGARPWDWTPATEQLLWWAADGSTAGPNRYHISWLSQVLWPADRRLTSSQCVGRSQVQSRQPVGAVGAVEIRCVQMKTEVQTLHMLTFWHYLSNRHKKPVASFILWCFWQPVKSHRKITYVV